MTKKPTAQKQLDALQAQENSLMNRIDSINQSIDLWRRDLRAPTTGSAADIRRHAETQGLLSAAQTMLAEINEELDALPERRRELKRELIEEQRQAEYQARLERRESVLREYAAFNGVLSALLAPHLSTLKELAADLEASVREQHAADVVQGGMRYVFDGSTLNTVPAVANLGPHQGRPDVPAPHQAAARATDALLRFFIDHSTKAGRTAA